MRTNDSLHGKVLLFVLSSLLAAILPQLATAQNTSPFPSSGNVGIGTTSPPNPLTVARGGSAPYTGRPANELLQLVDKSDNTPQVLFGSAYNGMLLRYTGTDTSATNQRLGFFTGGGTEAFVFNNDGNVGIGTTNPTDKFHVNNAIRISPFSPNAAGSYLNAGAVLRLLNGNIYQQGGSETSSIQFGGMYNPTGSQQTDAYYNYIDWAAGWLRIRNNQQTKIQIGAGDEWGRQDIYFNPDGGNVGIGTTTPGSSFPVTTSLDVLSRNSVSAGLAVRGGSDGRIAYFATRDFNNNGGIGTGLYVSSASGTGNTSVGLDVFSSGGGAYSNLTLQRYGGNVGLGTANPGSKLDVNGSIYNSGQIRANGLSLLVWGDGVGGNSRILSGAPNIESQNTHGLELGTTSSAPVVIYSAGVERVRVDSSTTSVTGNLTASGSINAKYQDVAEWVPASEQLAAGTVVVLDSTKSNQVTSSSVSYDTRVAGVVSEQPGIALGEKSDTKVLVATTGRVRVKVDATKGPIHVGDLLVTSDISGVAMKSEPVNVGGVQFHRPGTLIGKALEPLERGKGEILVLLSLQ